MALFSFSKGDSHTVALFDIRSASVGAALVEVKKGEKPEVLYHNRLPLSFQENLNFDFFMRSMLGVLLQSSLQLQSEGIKGSGRKIGSIVCVFSSPWFISQTRILKTKKQSSFVVSRRFLEECIEKARSDFQSSKLAREAENLNRKAVLIEHHVIQTILNGYPVSHPYGKEAYEALIALFMSMISEDVLGKVKEIFEKVFRVDDVAFHSFALASFLVLRDLFYNDDNFLLVDISGEVSDVSIVYNDILYETASFPLGKNSIIRELRKEEKMLPEEAHTALRLSAEGALSSPAALAVTRVEKRWLDALKEALKSLGDDLPLPQKMFVTADRDVSLWFEKTLQKGDFSEVAYAAQPFSPLFLGHKELHPHVSFGREAFDPFIAVLALFLERGM